MNGFTEDMQVVTLGKGLMPLSKLADTDAKALYENVSYMKVSSKPIGYESAVKLTIHSEDDKGQDIFIKCSPTQRFWLWDGNKCTAQELKGKRLRSIGVNQVYCTDVKPLLGSQLMYTIIKLEHSFRESVYINGIKVLI